MTISNANLNASATVGYLVTVPFVDTDAYTISFPYLSATDFEVEVNNVILDAADYTIDTNAALLRLTASAVAQLNIDLVLLTEAPLIIRRKTPILTRSVNYIDSSTLTAADLDLQANQLFYALQEAQDKADLGSVGSNPVTGTLDFGDLELTSVGEPLSETSAATLGTVLHHLGIAAYTQDSSYYLGNLVINSGSVYRANKTVKPAPAVLSVNDFDLMFTPSQIISNTASIATNATDIATNATDIATNAADIATNAAGVATNLANNTNNASAITGLDSSKLDAAGGTISGNLIVSGDLTVSGTNNIANTTNMIVQDANITVNSGGNQASADLNKSGITVEMSDSTDVVLGYDSTIASKFKVGEVGSESEIITADSVQVMKDKTVEASSNTSKALVVKGALGQTEDLLDVQDSTGASKLKVGADGTLSVKGAGNNNDATIVREDASDHFISMSGTSGNRSFRFGSDSMTADLTKTGLTFYTGNSIIRHNGYGTSSQPSYSWRADSDTGIFRVASNTIGFATGAFAGATLSTYLFKLRKAVFKPAEYHSSNMPAASSYYGGVIYDTDVDKLKYSDGLSWSSIGSGAGGASGKQSMYYTETFDNFSGTEFESKNGGVIGAGSVVTNIAGVDIATQLDGTKSATFTIPNGGAGTYALLTSIRQFSVPLYAQSKRQLMTFESRSTGNTGDFSVFIWDTTAGATIKDSAGNTLFIDPANGTQTNKLYFETNGTANLQWGVMINNSNDGAVLTIDNMSIDGSPDTKVDVYASSDWVDAGPISITCSGDNPTKGTTTTDTFKWRREGSSMHVRMLYQQTTVGSDGSGTYLFSIPSGYSIDLSRLPNAQSNDQFIVGSGSVAHDADASGRSAEIMYSSTSNTSVYMRTRNESGDNYQYVGSDWYKLGNSSAPTMVYMLDFKVPILGWSDKEDNVVVSGTKATYAYVECTGNGGETIAPNTQDIPYIATNDTKDLWNGTQFTADRDMVISIAGGVRTDGDTLDAIAIYVNGINKKVVGVSGGNIQTGSIAFSSILKLNAGDIASVRLHFGSTSDLSAGNNNSHYLTIKELPNYEDLILAYLDESVVAAKYGRGGTYSFVADTQTVIPYTTKHFDTSNAYNTTTGVYTVPVSGYYSYAVSLTSSSNTTTIDFEVGIRVNGVDVHIGLSNSSASYTTSQVNGIERLTKGDQVEIVALNAGSTMTLLSNEAFSQFSINRLR